MDARPLSASLSTPFDFDWIIWWRKYSCPDSHGDFTRRNLMKGVRRRERGERCDTTKSRNFQKGSPPRMRKTSNKNVGKKRNKKQD